VGLFDRKKKNLVSTGLPGTAVIRAERRAELAQGDDTTYLADYGIGKYKYHFELEVTLDDGRPPYPVSGKFRVPAKAGGEPAPGVTLPVHADPDDPTRIEIDWDRFIAGGGATEHREDRSREHQAAVHQTLPDATRAMMVDGWIAATKAGAMSTADFEQTVANAVQGGMLTPAEAEAARSAVG
jgi:hypothetical protein